ncbi:MAG TPA: S41 family peptidase [Terriglobales bacterium]|nr:S41 family peptidase [Terriglobales bacterium]
MSKQVKAAILSTSLVIVAFTVIGGLGVKASTGDGAYKQMGVYSEVLTRISKEYVEEPNMPNVTDGALHGLLESLDANSSYLTPAEYRSYRERKEGKGGTGATISKRFGYAAVISVLPGSPADKAGVEAGDIIEGIEGKTTRDMSLAQINLLLSGAPGSQVNISVVRARKAEPQKITIVRDNVSVPPPTEKMMEDSVGYIKVDGLPKGRASEIASRIKSLQKSGAKKLVLDLRNTSEGDEAEGVAVANLFLNHGTIAYLQGQKYPREDFTADPSRAVTSLPVVVLVNRGTAGPAEIVAAAILENARGDVVGDKTFGVGSVQKVLEVPGGSALILSVAKYYSPAGKAIQDTAVTPNIVVADNDDDISPDDDENAPQQPEKRPPQEDEQLKRAIEVLKNRTAKAELNKQ